MATAFLCRFVVVHVHERRVYIWLFDLTGHLLKWREIQQSSWVTLGRSIPLSANLSTPRFRQQCLVPFVRTVNSARLNQPLIFTLLFGRCICALTSITNINRPHKQAPFSSSDRFSFKRTLRSRRRGRLLFCAPRTDNEFLQLDNG